MKKITITDNIKKSFKNLVFSIFKNQNNNFRLIKKENKKIKFDITLKDLDKLINKKLKKFDENINFEKLIIADFEYIQELVKFIDNNREHTKLNKLQKEYFLTLYKRLNKKKFIQELNITTCLYCNRNYIFNFKKKNTLQSTAQLDHFFDKTHYPYLAVSLYNLIPCCPTCNLRKSNKKVNIFHPYVECFDETVKFKLTIIKSNFYHSTNGFNISLIPRKKVSNEIKEKIDTHIEIFNLKNLYEEHKDIILELIQKKHMYDESYLDELIKKYEGILFKNKEDLMKLISGGYISEDEINKRPLSKLIKDILESISFY